MMSGLSKLCFRNSHEYSLGKNKCKGKSILHKTGKKCTCSCHENNHVQ